MDQLTAVLCGNCNTEAVFSYITETGATFLLCRTCKDAFELGQVNVEAELTIL